jgi:hypothetical protein
MTCRANSSRTCHISLSDSFKHDFTAKWLLYIVSGVLAVFLAWVDVGCNTLLFSVWREEVGPYMQFLHFCFGVGKSPPSVSTLFKSLFKLIAKFSLSIIF